MVDLVDIGLELDIWLYRYGDRTPLIETLRERSTPIPVELNKDLADALASTAATLPRNKTYRWLAREKYQRERLIFWRIEEDMHAAGKRRDKNLRTYLKSKWCKHYDVKEDDYDAAVKHGGMRILSHKELRGRIAHPPDSSP